MCGKMKRFSPRPFIPPVRWINFAFPTYTFPSLFSSFLSLFRSFLPLDWLFSTLHGREVWQLTKIERFFPTYENIFYKSFLELSSGIFSTIWWFSHTVSGCCIVERGREGENRSLLNLLLFLFSFHFSAAAAAYLIRQVGKGRGRRRRFWRFFRGKKLFT